MISVESFAHLPIRAAVVANLSLSMLLSSFGTFLAREAEHATK